MCKPQFLILVSISHVLNIILIHIPNRNKHSFQQSDDENEPRKNYERTNIIKLNLNVYLIFSNKHLTTGCLTVPSRPGLSFYLWTTRWERYEYAWLRIKMKSHSLLANRKLFHFNRKYEIYL